MLLTYYLCISFVISMFSAAIGSRFPNRGFQISESERKGRVHDVKYTTTTVATTTIQATTTTNSTGGVLSNIWNKISNFFAPESTSTAATNETSHIELDPPFGSSIPMEKTAPIRQNVPVQQNDLTGPVAPINRGYYDQPIRVVPPEMRKGNVHHDIRRERKAVANDVVDEGGVIVDDEYFGKQRANEEVEKDIISNEVRRYA
ncbi:uncharacterized protein [Parasteatoda tepidariorum]|uniref:uncharacterized protein n=1 Tax=Parasteatoda tepidariorum TaxID=114398 RepID=UPI001C7272F0|nr:uncharacterized protein LOC107442265 [Parasteatoda tepidariorum]